ncbi:MFS transporter [Fodinisporobacter ferrooxydans]|uniref:MFS transporter n=1 Tax=Fodinisporobacter ferrooxydans TaxID=2901836 RepID=A0ABY4CPJ7_9BACL|nr:MFS transporter [Alicyclobacillaceae bacterium MYW30-H2]
MESWKRNLWILWFGVLLVSSSYTMIIPFLPLFVSQLGVAHHVKVWAGILFSVTFFFSFLLAPYWGSLADKYGRRSMIIRAGIGLIVTYGLGAFVQTPWELLGVRVLHGLVSGFVPGSIALVATNTPEKHMGWSLGMMATASSTGGILGPLVGGILSHLFSIRASFLIASALLVIATLLITLFVKEENFHPGKPRSRILSDLNIAFHNRPFVAMLVILIIVQISIMILEPLITLYIKDLQGRMEGTVLLSGIIFSAAGIASILSAPRWGKIGQKQGYRNVLILSLAGGGLLNIAQLFAHTVWMFGLIRFLYGLFIAGVFPTINAMIVERTDAEFRGRAFGLSTSANQFGSMVGPLVGGVLGGWLGIQYVFVITGILLSLTAIAVIWANRKSQQLVRHVEKNSV